MVVVDGLNLAIFAHTSMVHQLEGASEPSPAPIFQGVELFLASLFLLEIIARIYAWKWAFILGRAWIENIVETVVVVSTFAIAVSTFAMDVAEINNEWARLARSLRFGRVIRFIVKTKRLLPLRFMMSSMLNCGPTLLWSMLVISFVLSFFSVFLMLVASDWLDSADTSERQRKIEAFRTHYYGYFATMVSLFMAVTGGSDWRDLYQPLWETSSSLGLCFLCYICVMVLGVFNVLVGVCADRAFAASRAHHDFVMHDERTKMLGLLHEVSGMFRKITQEGSEWITREQFLACQGDSEISAFFKSHQMDMIDPTWLFHMLDQDGSGSVTASELAIGLLRLSGQARSSDVLLLVALALELREDMSKLKKCTKERFAQPTEEHELAAT